MSETGAIPAKRKTLSLRMTREDRELIERAAKAKGKNLKDFVMDATRAAIEEALAEQQPMMVDPGESGD